MNWTSGIAYVSTCIYGDWFTDTLIFICLKSYAMRRLPRGKALIINVNEVEGKPPRRGTDIDRDNLYHLLTQLHFDVRVYNDRDGLTAKVGQIAQNRNRTVDHTSYLIMP